MNQNIDDNSDSDLDSAQFKHLYSKLEKRMISRQQQASIDLEQQPESPKHRSRHHNTPQSRHRQRQRSRDKPKQNVCWHIYEDVEQIDYVDTLPDKLHKLPIFKKKDQIIQKIIQNQIVLITGDTGCGKSTQVPRLIYEYLKKIGKNDKIICVQPRRLAVTSLKSAVQAQLPDRQRVVGYQIGQKAQFNSHSRIVFMTNGIFLQRITHDTNFLNEYPFVVLDEVHERDIDTDFILTALKRIIRGFPKVRIVLMSATIDNELFRYYFASDHIDEFMKKDNFYKQIIEIEEYEKAKNANLDDQSNQIFIQEDSDEQQTKKRKIYDTVALKFLQSRFPCPAININEPSNFHRTYFYLDTLKDFVKRQHAKKWGSIHWSYRHPNTYKQLYEAATIILSQIRYNCRSKHDLSGEAVLVFLPGLNEIENFSEEIFTFLGGRDRVYDDFELIHVHSTIMTETIQQKINTPNRKQIKLIISTNIAESSITVKGVKYVIDFCLTKQIRYDDKSRMENLELVYSSKASCKQRAGRTGRVCDGYIFRMVERKFYDAEFQDYSEPEIKRSSLDKLILRIKLMHENDKRSLFADPPEVLGTCIQPPRLQSIQSAITSLKFCGGLQQNGENFIITQLGKLYVEIPIDIAYTKLLIVSILFGTFYDTLILVSMLSQNKNAIHRRQIENNFYKYFDRISNHEYCDFLALVNLFKEQEDARKGVHDERKDKRDNPPKERLKFAIYTQTKNTMQDIIKRLQRKWFNFTELSDYLEYRDGNDIRLLSKKCHIQKNPKPKYKDYFMRWKMTLAFGFVDKMIVIKPPMFDPKQEKRIKDMNRVGIQNERTVVLLNSSNISLSRNTNPELQQRAINHWKKVFLNSINCRLSNLTLTSGLNYLHFDDDLELNKLLFYKEMDSNVRRRGTGCVLSRDDEKKSREVTENNSFLSVKQLIECLGDIDHMQTGIPYTLGKEQRVRIDQHSLNRVCSYVESAPNQYLLTNSFMLQGKHDLVCRYTSALNIFSFDRSKPPNTVLHILSNLLFYPFVKLKSNKQQTAYEYLALKKNYLMKIQYQMKDAEIEKANVIREIVKEFFRFERKLTSDSCEQFWKLVKAFVVRKRISKMNQINDEMWQGEFMKQVKQGKIKTPQAILTPKVSSIHQNGQINHEANNNTDRIIQEINSQMTNQPQTNGKNHPFTSTYETRNFMNPILLPQITANESYFLRAKLQTSESYQNRILFYLNWKKSKLNQVQQLSKYVLDNETYLCCGHVDQKTNRTCDVVLCRLRRVGPMDDDFVCRDMFDPIMTNLKVSIEPETQIDDYLINQTYQDEYLKFSCINNHEIGIQNKGTSKIKIFVMKSYTVKYPDIENSPTVETEFEKLEIQHCIKEQAAAIKRKQKQPLKKSCFLCGFNFLSYQELKDHMKDKYHEEAVEKFKKSIEIGEKNLLGGEKEEEEEIEYVEKVEGKAEDKNKKKEKDNEQIEIEY